jgi:hypothetical protein
MSDIFVNDNFYQGTSQACIVDLTPPTFAGITSLTVQSRGQIRAIWAAATDATAPIRYEMYIKAGTATGLFSTSNIIAITPNLQFDTFTMPDGSFLVNGTTYYVGIRAIDAISNRDSNIVSMSVISTGVYVSNEIYSTAGVFSRDLSGNFTGTLWALKNHVIATSLNSTLDTASYQVYDKDGNAVIGMSGSGISSNIQGQYIITPVTDILDNEDSHYVVKITINVDSADRSDYSPIAKGELPYEILGNFFVNSSNEFDGSFWIMEDEIIATTNLGTGSYQVYDFNGAPVVGMSQSGITANGAGIFTITNVASLIPSNQLGYSVRISLMVDGTMRSMILPLNNRIPTYECHAVFAINALNQFQGTLWASQDNQIKSTSLGTANYTVYDSLGIGVVGLSQSGITADVNGRFILTPVSATLLTDLTNYTVKVGIIVDGVERISYKGFTLLGN